MELLSNDITERELYDRLEAIGQACWENRERQRQLSARIRSGDAIDEDTYSLEIIREVMASLQQQGDRFYEKWTDHLGEQSPDYRFWKISLNVDEDGKPISWADRVCHRHNFRQWVEWLAELTDEVNSREESTQ